MDRKMMISELENTTEKSRAYLKSLSNFRLKDLYEKRVLGHDEESKETKG